MNNNEKETKETKIWEELNLESIENNSLTKKESKKRDEEYDKVIASQLGIQTTSSLPNYHKRKAERREAFVNLEIKTKKVKLEEEKNRKQIQQPSTLKK